MNSKQTGKQEREAAQLKDDMTSLKEHLSLVDKTVDPQEQYSRRYCLFVHGVKEKSNKDTSQVIIDFV